MADRYGERYRGEQYRDERGYGREDRGFMERTGDEVRSWFGDEEAERRRRLDERERERERYRERAIGRDYGPAFEYGGTTGEGYTRPYGTRVRDFRGRGPKGYQRSDARINEDVCDRLSDAPEIDASNIEVRVSNGEVTLSGTVPEREDKRRCEDLIESISGVREVHNNLRVSGWPEGTTGASAATGTAGAGGATGTTRR